MLDGAADTITEDFDAGGIEGDDEAGDGVETDIADDTLITGAEASDVEADFPGPRKEEGSAKLEKALTGFQIPFKVAVNEANLGRPVRQGSRT